jgi:hypothetical protein
MVVKSIIFGSSPGKATGHFFPALFGGDAQWTEALIRTPQKRLAAELASAFFARHQLLLSS